MVAQVNLFVNCVLSFLCSVIELSLCVVDVWTVAFSPDSQQIATGSHNGKISLFSVEDGTKTTTLDTGGKFVLSIACVSGHGQVPNNLHDSHPLIRVPAGS